MPKPEVDPETEAEETSETDEVEHSDDESHNQRVIHAIMRLCLFVCLNVVG